MAKTLEEVLKSRGYSDADLAGLAPSLTDPKFRAALESGYSELEGQALQASSEAAEWAKWRNEKALPTIDKYMKEAAEERAKRASIEERVKFAKEQGLGNYFPPEDTAPPNPAPQNPYASFDPSAHNLVTQDRLNEVARMEGAAIATVQDISAEHWELYGAPLRNWRELKSEAEAKKISVEQHWKQKYNIDGKRAELEAKRKQEYEDNIRKDERMKYAQEYGNPSTRPPGISNNPFTKKSSGPDAGKQPWESDRSARANDRVARVYAKTVQ